MRRHRFTTSDGSRYLTRAEVREATAPPNLERIAPKSPHGAWTYRWNKERMRVASRRGGQ